MPTFYAPGKDRVNVYVSFQTDDPNTFVGFSRAEVADINARFPSAWAVPGFRPLSLTGTQVQQYLAWLNEQQTVTSPAPVETETPPMWFRDP